MKSNAWIIFLDLLLIHPSWVFVVGYGAYSRDIWVVFVVFVLMDEILSSHLYRIGISNVRDLMSLLIMNREGLLRFSKGAPIHTDDNFTLFSFTKYNASKNVFYKTRDVRLIKKSTSLK